MRVFFPVQFRAALCCLFFVYAGFTQSNSRYARQYAGADPWVTHNDPAGFVVDIPPAWTVAKDPATGRIVLRGARGEQAVIWPLLLQHVELDVSRAAVLLPQLAGRVDAQMPWSRAQSINGVVRAFASGGQRSGAALLSWANAANGASAYFYCLEAPRDVYRNTTDSFVRILNSFHVVPDQLLKDASQPGIASGTPALSLVKLEGSARRRFQRKCSTRMARNWRHLSPEPH